MMLLRWTPVARRAPPAAGRARLRLPDRRPRGVDAWLRRQLATADPQLEVVQHRLRVVDTEHRLRADGAVPSSAPPEPGAGGARPAPVAARSRLLRCPCHRRRRPPGPSRGRPEPALAPAEATSRRCWHRRRADRLPAATCSTWTSTSRPTSGIDTVKQAEMFAAIREALRDRPRRQPQAARLPDPQPRHRLDPRPSRHPGAQRRPRRHRPRRAPTPPAQPAGTPPAAAPAPAADELTADACWASSPSRPATRSDLLDMDLDLEADLGIDTVKQAEMFAAIREALRDRPRRQPQAARLPDPQPRHRLHPRQDRHPGAHRRPRRHRPRPRTDAAGPARRDPAAGGPTAGCRRVDRRPWCDIVAEQTGYPHDLLDMDLDLEADLGDRHRQASRDLRRASARHYGIDRDDTLKLRDYPDPEPRHRFDPRPNRGEPPRQEHPVTRRLRLRRTAAAAPTVNGDIAATDRIPAPGAGTRAAPELLGLRADRGHAWRRQPRGGDARRGRRRRRADHAADPARGRGRRAQPDDDSRAIAPTMAVDGVYWLRGARRRGSAATDGPRRLA